MDRRETVPHVFIQKNAYIILSHLAEDSGESMSKLLSGCVYELGNVFGDSIMETVKDLPQSTPPRPYVPGNDVMSAERIRARKAWAAKLGIKCDEFGRAVR